MAFIVHNNRMETMAKKKTKPKARATATKRKIKIEDQWTAFQKKLTMVVKDELESRINFKTTKYENAKILLDVSNDLMSVHSAVQLLHISNELDALMTEQKVPGLDKKRGN